MTSKKILAIGKAWREFASGIATDIFDILKRRLTMLKIKNPRDIITDVHTIRHGKFTVTFITGMNTVTLDTIESYGVAIKNPTDRDDPELGKLISQNRALMAFRKRVFYQPITKRFMG